MVNGENDSILNTTDCFLIFLITILGIVTRFWLNGYPDYDTFDEVHFGNFTNSYIKQEYFFDIHPPLAKLIIALVSYLSGYKGDINFNGLFSQKYFDKKTQSYLIDYISLRLSPQLFSSFVPALIYVTMRIMRVSIISSFVSSILLIFETSIICEGKFILTDGILHFFVSLHLLSLFYACQYPTVFSLFLDGITLGFACSCKSTAWSLPVIDGIVHIYFIFKKHQKNQTVKFNSKSIYNISLEIITRGLFLIVLMLSTYYLFFVIHISILKFNGNGSAFLRKSVRKTLLHSENFVNSSNYTIEPLSKRLTSSSVFYHFLTLNIEMQASNMRIKSFHPFQSDPLSWPLLTSSYVGFLSIDDDHEVNCLGNVFVYYPAFFAIVFIFIHFTTYSIKSLILFLTGKKDYSSVVYSFSNWKFFFVFFGYLINYLPFILIPRCLFLYHYQIPLIFACMAVGMVLDFLFFIPSAIEIKREKSYGINKIINKSDDFDDFKQVMNNYLNSRVNVNFLFIFGACIASLIALLAFCGFVIWYPYLYGTRITNDNIGLKIYRKVFRISYDPYSNVSPHKLYRKLFIPDNWIWGDTNHRKLSRKNDDLD